MDTISIELTIKGNDEEIISFIKEFNGTKNERNCHYPLNCNNNLMIVTDDNFCFMKFETRFTPSQKWLTKLRQKYPTFIVNIFWQKIYDFGALGFIEEDGTKYEVNGFDELKKAVKLYVELCSKESIVSKGMTLISIAGLSITLGGRATT
jgi:hypothetical protein